MIPLSSEAIGTILGFRITDTVTSTLLTDVAIILLLFAVNRKISIQPGKFQSVLEIVIKYFYSAVKEIAGTRTNVIFGWFASFFAFIFIANILGLLPGYTAIEILDKEHNAIPLFRTPTSDFNTTFALAVVSVAATQILSIKYIGIKNYLKKFFSFSPILLFIGLLELVSEFTKLVSFSFRLFGNIFAGEIVLSRISSLFTIILPIPFLMLEIMVAIVQALIFATLTMVFMSIFTTEHAA